MAESGFDGSRPIDLNAKLDEVVNDYVEAGRVEAELRASGTELSPTPVIDSLVRKLSPEMGARALKEIDFIRTEERRRTLGKVLGITTQRAIKSPEHNPVIRRPDIEVKY